MTYVSSNVIQNNTQNVALSSTKQEIICIEIVTTGSNNPLSVTSFDFNTTGSTNAMADISNAKVYYTETNFSFATTNQFGTTLNSPNGNFTIAASQTLAEGTNYFWLTYDVQAGATLTNVVDAQCTALTVGTAKTPTETNPAGNRKIWYCSTNVSNTSEYIENFQLGTNINQNSFFSTNGYEDYTSQSTDILINTPVNFSVGIKNIFTFDQILIWADLNNDGDFKDANENLHTSATSGLPTPYTGTITIPVTANLGSTTLRIRLHDTSNGPNTTPCGNSVYGEVEDYTINIIAPEINLTGNSVTIANGDATPTTADHTDFGNVTMSSNLVRTYTIQNTGTANLTISVIAISGANSELFTVGGITLPATISASSSTTFTVTYAPTSIGLHTATVTLTNTDNDEGTYDFAIRGMGINSAGLWQGDVSDDWFDAANWNGGLTPDGTCSGGTGADIDVVIPNVKSINSAYSFPVIRNGASNIAYCNNLEIQAGAILTIEADGKLTVCNTLENNASASGLVIKSNSSSTGSLIQNSGAVPATVQRYMSALNWHLTYPTTDAVPIKKYIVGNTSIYSYDETTDDYWNTTINFGTNGQTFASGISNPNNGYFYYNYTNQTLNLEGGNLVATDKNFPVTYTTNGHLVTDLVNVPEIGNMAYSNFAGWNLIGNPYASTIDWNFATGADYSSIENGIYIWDGSSKNYKYYMNGGTAYTSIAINQYDATCRYIAAGQGFFVKAKNNGTITIPKDARTHTTQNFWKTDEKQTPELIRIQIVKNGFIDETAIWLANEATQGHDADFDLYKRFSMNTDVPQIYTFNNTGNLFALNTLPKVSEHKIIPIGVYIGASGEHTIQFTENNISGFNIYLEDKLLNKTINTKTVNSYTFSSATGLIIDRFVLNFYSNDETIVENNFTNVYPNPSNGKFIIEINKISNYHCIVKDLLGKTVIERNDSYSEIEIDLSAYAKGVYVLIIEFDDNTFVTKKLIVK